MGKNKLIKFAELQTFGNVIQVPANGLTIKDHPLKGKWSSDFFRNNNPITLELGCGKGEYTVGLAEKYPAKNFIGIDIKGARIWSGAKAALQKNMSNVGFLRTKIEFINSFFDSDEVHEIWLTFPDPMMDKTTRRLTSANFLENYRKFLLSSGIIHLKTDSNFLFHYTCAVIEKNMMPVYAKTNNLYASELLNEILEIRTFYEKQWMEREIDIKYIAFGFREQSEKLAEPEGYFEKDNYRSFGRGAQNR